MHDGVLKRYSPVISIFMRVLDVGLCILGAVLAHGLYFGARHFGLPIAYSELTGVAVLLVLLVFPALAVYRSWRSSRLLAPVIRVLTVWCIVFVVIMVLLVLVKRAEVFSRVWLALWFGWVALLLIVSRVATFWILRLLRGRGHNSRHVFVVGTGGQAGSLIQRVREDAWAGFVIDRVFCLTGSDGVFQGITKAPLSQMEAYLQSGSVDEVWIALPLGQSALVSQVLALLRDSSANIRYVPDLAELFLLNHGMSEVMSVPMIDLRASRMQGGNGLVKGLEDRLLAALILIFISPLMLLIAVGVKLSSSGPVFFRQDRVGWNGRIFKMLKFRSMPIDAEAVTGAVWANRQDGRATRFGAFLRRTSLDELPQFINVLKGEMSIVGPRPERPVFVNKFKNEIPGYMQKHMVKAGITGLAQINGYRGRTDLGRRIHYDLYYIEHWSLWLDFKIIFLTIFKGFVNRNAY